jgi:thiamine pyrophosphokinase
VNTLRASERSSKTADTVTPKTKTACVFCNGELDDLDSSRAVLADAEMVIAANGGSKHLAALGVKPHVLIGDIDSVGPDMPWKNEDITCVSYPADKDRSDTELAVAYAFEHGCEQVTLMAAMGRRLDHTLGNIALVAAYPGRVAMLQGKFTLVAIDPTKKCVLHGIPGSFVSLIPYGKAHNQIKTRGLRYPLDNEPLLFPTHGLSNALSETEACVCVSEGTLLVCIATGWTA